MNIPEHLFSSERPIETLADDQLGRTDFATAVAKVIVQWNGRDSLVLAIYGPWGSGKSSLKNMVLDALQKQNAKTVSLEFNPWEWSGQEKIFEGFFGELSAKLGSSDKGKNAAKTATVMRMYGAMLAAAAFITRGFRTILVTLLFVLGFFGIAPLFTKNGYLLWSLAIFGSLSVVAAAILASFGNAADKLAAYLAARSEVTRRSVAETKKELTTLLRTLQKNVLVVIDDIDRLPPENIRMIFQLVKANADFPNLVYVLLFQRETIEKALSGMGGVDGAQFLDKVVQVGFDIPKLSPEKLENALDSGIRAVVENTPAERKFDAQRWPQLFISAIRPYFQTLRDTKRFSNSLSFHFELYRNGDTFDANPIDLIALEVLRQFEPLLYQKLHSARELLTGRSGLSFDLPQGHKKEVEALFEKTNRPDCARSIIEELFPPAATALAESEVTIRSTFTDQWLRDLRVCHPDVFERYFRFSLAEEDLSETDFASLLAAVAHRDRFVAKLKELNQKRLLSAAVGRLRIDLPLISTDNGVPFITGLFDIEKELFPLTSGRGVTAVPLEQRAIAIVHSVLRQVSLDKRGPILKESTAQTTALYLPMMSFEWSKEQREQKSDPLVSDQDAEQLQQLCLDKVRAATQTQDLLSHPRLRYILRVWLRWGSIEEAPNWVKSKASASDLDLLALLKPFTEQMNQMEENHLVRVLFKFALEDFARYVEPQEIADRVSQLASSSPDREDKIRCQLFLRALKNWKPGDKSDELASAGTPDLGQWTTIEDLKI